MSDYITSKELSEKWGIGQCRIIRLAREGRIEGAKLLGKTWMFPENSQKPADGRTRQAKQNIPFRFPLYINSDINGISPALTEEEALLIKAQKDFYACDFKSSLKAMKSLAHLSDNIYIRISANAFMCLLSAVYDTAINWNQYFDKMNIMLLEDFPNRKEMELFIPFVDFTVGKFSDIPKHLQYDYEDGFHPSVWYLNSFLSLFNFNSYNDIFYNPMFSEPFETMCKLMERDGYFFEALETHLMLFVYSHSMNNSKATEYHLKKAVSIAYEHNIIFPIADAENYYADELDKILLNYLDSFSDKIKAAAKIIQKNFSNFAETILNTDVYSRLSRRDYVFILYATKGFSNKQVAKICDISIRTVAKRYDDIYNKIGVNNKNEMIKAMRSAL